MLNRNPFYLLGIFIAYLIGKAIWIQLDIAGEFRHGAVSRLFFLPFYSHFCSRCMLKIPCDVVSVQVNDLRSCYTHTHTLVRAHIFACFVIFLSKIFYSAKILLYEYGKLDSLVQKFLFASLTLICWE